MRTFAEIFESTDGEVYFLEEYLNPDEDGKCVRVDEGVLETHDRYNECFNVFKYQDEFFRVVWSVGHHGSDFGDEPRFEKVVGVEKVVTEWEPV